MNGMDGLGLQDGQGLNLGASATPRMNEDQLNAWIDATIKNNTQKNFIDRIARAQEYPVLPTEDGGMATHMMSWSTMGKDKTPVVYPTVIFDPESRALKQLDPESAFLHAQKNKEYLPFPTPEAADLFSREYKRHWRTGNGPKGYQP